MEGAPSLKMAWGELGELLKVGVEDVRGEEGKGVEERRKRR